MAFKAWLERKLHPGQYILRDLQEMSRQLKDDDYKQVIDRAIEQVEVLNLIYRH